MLSLSFRNESEAVIEKAQAKAAKSRSNSENRSKAAKIRESHTSTQTVDKPLHQAIRLTPTSTSLAPRTPSRASNRSDLSFNESDFESIAQQFRTPSPPVPSLEPSFEERAINFFFKHHVAEPSPFQGPFQYLRAISIANGLDDAIKSSITATGLAGLANVSKSPRMISLARKEYSNALRIVNSAIASPIDALKDSTLISILILAIFESTTCSKGLSLKAWTEHINGAAALVKLRGRTQFTTQTGMFIFLQAQAHLLISCIQRSIPVPESIIALSKQAFSEF
jgi:hypothetical protein